MNKNYCWRHRLRKIKPVYCANTKNGQSNNPDFIYDCLRRSRDNNESGSGSNEKRKESVFKRLRVSDDRISVVAAAVVVVVVVSAVVDDVVSAVVVIVVSAVVVIVVSVVVVVVVAFSAVVVAIFVVVIVVLRFGKSENNIFDHAQRK